MKPQLKTIATLLLVGLTTESGAKTVRYELTATRGTVNMSGKESVDFALMINGKIPAPTLEFNEGDDAEIVVKNRIPHEELSIHWHGILLPPEMDGVPYVTTPTIYSGEDLTFKFKIRQHGTYWYHSHTNVQEQKGLYGAFIIHPRKPTIKYDKEVVAVVSDWSDEDATKILNNLRKDGDFYLYKKGTMRSWIGAIQAGSLGNYLYNEWTRMGGMDFSDVGYDAFLINGKKDSQLIEAYPGEKVRVRIINAAASSYFHISLGQAPMNVISVDGVDIEPIFAKEILTGMAETHDILFEVPENKNYELKVTAQDGTGSASGWIGMGEKVPAPQKPFPDMYATMDHGSHGDHSAHTQSQSKEHHNHHHPAKSSTPSPHGDHSNHKQMTSSPKSLETIEALTVDEIKAKENTELPKSAKVLDVKLVLNGDMERYIWHINGNAIFEDRTIEISEGDIVRFTFQNKTMMHHPMHLHGHFFRVLNQHGTKSPLKHTVDVPPHGTRTIEFYANEPGEWMLHCHNLYHLKTGMARVVKYSSFTPKPEIAQHQKHDPHLHDHVYFYGMAEAATNHAQLFTRFSQTWNQYELRMEGRNSSGKHFSFKEDWEVEGDLFYRRWFNQFFNVIGGGTVFDKKANATVGIGYMLPLLIEVELLVSHRGKFRIGAEKRFQWHKFIYTDVDFTWRPFQGDEVAHDVEYEVSLMFSPSWYWSAGLMFADETLGAGIQLQF